MLPDRYSKKDIKRAIENPILIRNEIKRVANASVESTRKLPWKFWSQIFKYRYDEGVAVMDRDWDNLIILDTCRYDAFKKENWLDGELSHIISKGATTSEFLEANFAGRELYDTVYVTSNPHPLRLDEGIFYTRESAVNQWDNDEAGTVLPSDMVEVSIEASKKYPNKRLIFHFMAPHAPHLGPTAETVRKRDDFNDELIRSDASYADHGIEVYGRNNSVVEACELGTVSRSELHKSYRETLQIVLDHIEKLLQSLQGKSVITSDHGEWHGDRHIISRQYGKYDGVWEKNLRKVPWFVPSFKKRRKIEKDDPIGFEDKNQTVVNDRLRALGYTIE